MNENLNTALAQAVIALKQNKICFIPSAPGLIEELDVLNIDDAEDIKFLLIELFKEIKLEHYLKSNTPVVRSDQNLSNVEFLHFIWNSKKMKKEMAIQFAIDEGCFYYFSLAPTCTEND